MNLNFQNSKNHSSGFTLLEVLIALAVLVFISLAIYQATIETYKLRDTLLAEGEFYNTITISTAVIQHDISLIYSPYSADPALKNDPRGQPQLSQDLIGQTDDLGRTFSHWAAAVNKTGMRPSHFIGSTDKLSFISLSHVRIYKDSQESEFARISYETKRDDKNTDNPGSLVLTKTESSNAFYTLDVKDTFSHTYPLLPGIKTIAFTYYKREGNTWKTSRSWDSDKEETKNIYPDLIEMKIEILGRRKQSFEGTFKFRPEMPFNGLPNTI